MSASQVSRNSEANQDGQAGQTNKISQARILMNHRVRWRSIVPTALASVYALMWAGGIVSHLLWGGVAPAEQQQWVAPLFLFWTGLIVMATTRSAGERFGLVCIALLGWMVELIGVSTGVLFGEYSYTNVLGPLVLNVPLVMACAWMALVAYLKGMLSSLNLRRWWAQSVVGALWMTAIDLVIDPLAAGPLGYWRWAESGAYYGIPLSNFVGWFMASLFIFSLVYVRFQPNRWARWLGLSIVIFFTLLALIHHLFLAASIGLGLCLLHLLVQAARSRSKSGWRL